jgi:hypothetical protein
VIFIINDPSTRDTFNLLKRNLVAIYGGPASEHMMKTGPDCFWQFASGNIMLHLYGAQGSFKGAVSLTYIKNPLGPQVLQSAL